MHLFDAGRAGSTAATPSWPAASPSRSGSRSAEKMQRRDGIVACFFGEGAVAEGEFHECMNLAELWQLPIVFCCENNLYAMGTSLKRSESETDIALKASSYEMPAWPVDGMDVVAVRDAATRAVDAVRNGGGPHFLELRTYRFRAHSMYDPELYREKAEVAQWKEHDPIPAMIAAAAIEQSEVDTIEADAKAEIDDAVAFAEQGTDEPVDDLTRFVTSEPGRT